jgi:hypothetical protein
VRANPAGQSQEHAIHACPAAIPDELPPELELELVVPPELVLEAAPELEPLGPGPSVFPASLPPPSGPLVVPLLAATSATPRDVTGMNCVILTAQASLLRSSRGSGMDLTRRDY